RYLEPAIVGIASVACGPAITTIISRCIDNRSGKNSGLEFIISWLIMVGVILMLCNSLMGKSGVTTTTVDERLIGIICVILSALGTVIYTFISRELYQRQWETYEILGFRNMLMLLIAVIYCFYADIPLSINMNLAAPMVLLVVIGHLLPIYLIQNTIKRLQPLHVSLVLLLLPVFTLLLQYFDTRVEISFDSIAAVSIIAILLFILGINKIIGNPKTKGA
ncbi:EamA family transporter, partial [Yersinia pestis]